MLCPNLSNVLEIINLACIDSTQLEVQRRLTAGELTRPLLIIAREQTAGRGRLGRTWFGQPEHTLMFSLWSPTTAITAEHLPLLSLAAALALCEWLNNWLQCQIKWPNDILGPDGRKLAGILCEGAWNGTVPRGAIIGVGINISWPNSGPPADLLKTAATLRDYACLASYSNLKDDLPSWVNHYLQWQEKIIAGHLESFAAAYNKKLMVQTRQVTYKSFESDSVVGYIEGISQAGKLLFRRHDNGALLEVTSGELALVDIPASGLSNS